MTEIHPLFKAMNLEGSQTKETVENDPTKITDDQLRLMLNGYLLQIAINTMALSGGLVLIKKSIDMLAIVIAFGTASLMLMLS